MTALLGRNRFIDCHSIIGLRGQPMLRASAAPLRVALNLPPDVVPYAEFEIEDNAVRKALGGAPSSLKVEVGQSSVVIFWGDVALVVATQLDATTAHLHVDLRPVGMNVYDDATGLHVGPNTLAGNTFQSCATAVMLA